MFINEEGELENECCYAVFCSNCRFYDECELIHPELLDEDKNDMQ